MSENNRNPIEKCRKRLSQFTTMNVIDGQAGLVIYSSLIFYSLTIDNILNIIVLLILAGVSIAMLTGDNGILMKTSEAKIETVIGTLKEVLKLEQSEQIIDNIKLTPELLLAEGKVTRTVQQGEDEKYYMYYVLKENAYKEMEELGKGNLVELKDIFLIDDKLNIKYISKDGKVHGDKIEKKILEDTTPIRFASKVFSDYILKILGAGKEENMTFGLMKTQTSLTINDSNVDSLQDLVFFPNLEYLQLGDWNNNIPPITTMNGIENCTKLKKLNIISGPDKDYSSIKKIQSLSEFYIAGGTNYEKIIDILSNCKRLENVSLINSSLSSMKNISKLGRLKSLSLANNGIKKIEGLSNIIDLKKLDLSNNKITNIEGLENLTKLESLNLYNNDIEDIIPLSKNTSLLSLNLKGNVKIDGDINNYKGEELEKLNKIGEILDRDGSINLDIDKLGLFTNYKKLDLSGQGMTTLHPLKGLTQLEHLNLYNNQITLKDSDSQDILRSMTNLNYLNLNNNKITNLNAVNSLTNLKSLYILGNDINLKQIEDIISNLNVFMISPNSLKTIVDCTKEKITTLNISSFNLKELPDLSKFEKLTTLNLTGNTSISNLNEISKIKNLQNLNLSGMELHDKIIDFSGLTNLTKIDLQMNFLDDEDLENLKTVKSNENLIIDLRNNSIINAKVLLELDSKITIRLSGNKNLMAEAKAELQKHFENITF